MIAELVKKEKSDEVIIATGSMPIIRDIPGVEKPAVATRVDLLLGKNSREKESLW